MDIGWREEGQREDEGMDGLGENVLCINEGIK